MSMFNRLPNLDGPGFNSGTSRSYLTLPLGSEVSIYIFQLGDAACASDNESVAIARSVGRVDSDKRYQGAKPRFNKVAVKGVSPGIANLIATDSWVPGMEERLPVAVVTDKEYRLVSNNGVSTTDPEIRKLLTTDVNGNALGLKALAVRVAEDQMNSALGRAADGGQNRYCSERTESGKPIDWCGAFAFWCYQKASQLLATPNPLGDNRDDLLSPQKAITWAAFHPDRVRVIGYSGPSILVDDKSGSRGRKARQEGIQATFDLDSGFDAVETGDICLVRNREKWLHVALVYQLDQPPFWGGKFKTIDGNQGYPSIKVVPRQQDLLDVGRLKHQYVFLHLL